jgi:hypothetical protein
MAGQFHDYEQDSILKLSISCNHHTIASQEEVRKSQMIFLISSDTVARQNIVP